MVDVYINKIATAVPDHDVHRKFIDFAPSLLKNERERSLLKRMADKAQIEHRYSFLRPHPEGKGFDADGFYRPGAFPDTQKRMRFYEQHALGLATRTLDQINFAEHRDSITHVIITTCTGFYAPGLDIQLIKHYGLQSSVERTVIGFMGCNAALNALKLSRKTQCSIFGCEQPNKTICPSRMKMMKRLQTFVSCSGYCCNSGRT